MHAGQQESRKIKTLVTCCNQTYFMFNELKEKQHTASMEEDQILNHSRPQQQQQQHMWQKMCC